MMFSFSLFFTNQIREREDQYLMYLYLRIFNIYRYTGLSTRRKRRDYSRAGRDVWRAAEAHRMAILP